MSEEEKDAGVAVAETEEGTAVGVPRKIDISVEMSTVGPCKKQVRVTVPRTEIDRCLKETLREFVLNSEVAGFRKGRVPRALVERKFRKEVGGQVLQRILMQSLEQLGTDFKLDAINEPDLDVEDLILPEEGDFSYEFQVEVRPEFELPVYEGLTIRRPVGEIVDADVTAYVERLREQFARSKPVDTPAELGDFVKANVRFLVNGEETARRSEIEVRIRPTIQFHDAVLGGFDKLMVGVVPGDQRSAQTTVSTEATRAELRGEPVTIEFEIVDVRRLDLAPIDEAFMASMGVKDEDELKTRVREVLERQEKYQQRQAAREQVLNQITASADWDLPESLVLRQVENALRREYLEMREAGYTEREVEARLARMRQNQLSETRQALKQHFILDKLATQENVVVEPADKEQEIRNMALQAGESARKVRARLEKEGLMENLEAQIRERKAVDLILAKAVFEDVPGKSAVDEAFPVDLSVCGQAPNSDLAAPPADAE